MYEFAFFVHHDPGANAWADALATHDSLRAVATYAYLSPDRMWRLEVVTGTEAALDAVEGLLLDADVDRETVTARGCTADRSHDLLTDERTRRVVYTHFADARRCDAVPLLAVDYAPTGMLATATRTGRTTRWRLLFADDRKVGMLYDVLGGRLADGHAFEFDRLVEADGWDAALLAPRTLPPEQRETLVAAVEQGYFETPRAVTLDELADEVGAPRSTVSYRLRRATAALAEWFVERS